jgi:hypothetical protein
MKINLEPVTPRRQIANMTRQTIRLQETVARQVKIACAKTGETMAEFYRRALINEFAARKNNQNKTTK